MRQRMFASAVVVAAAILVGMWAYSHRETIQAGPKEDEQSIRQATDAYAVAFNKGDLDAVLAFWAADAEHIDEDGKAVKGKEALMPQFKKMLVDTKGTKLVIKTRAIRLFNDVAFQDGTATMTWADGATGSNTFSAVWTRKDGKWLLTMVRDTPEPEAADQPNSKLNDLAWLAGDWSNEDKEMKTTLNVKWMKGRKFLQMELSVSIKGEETMSLTQIIGWDPSGNQVHSWFFDSRGGFGEGYWSQRGSTWIAEVAGLTADSRHGTGTNKYLMLDPDSFTFEAIDRELAGNALPDVKVTYVRVNKVK